MKSVHQIPEALKIEYPKQWKRAQWLANRYKSDNNGHYFNAGFAFAYLIEDNTGIAFDTPLNTPEIVTQLIESLKATFGDICDAIEPHGDAGSHCLMNISNHSYNSLANIIERNRIMQNGQKVWDYTPEQLKIHYGFPFKINYRYLHSKGCGYWHNKDEKGSPKGFYIEYRNENDENITLFEGATDVPQIVSKLKAIYDNIFDDILLREYEPIDYDIWEKEATAQIKKMWNELDVELG